MCDRDGYVFAFGWGSPSSARSKKTVNVNVEVKCACGEQQQVEKRGRLVEARWLEMHGLTALSGEACCAAMKQSVDMYLETNKVERLNKGK